MFVCVCFFLLRHREDDHAGEVRRAAAAAPLPLRGLQQVGGGGGSAPLPQQRDLQDGALAGLPGRGEEVSACKKLPDRDHIRSGSQKQTRFFQNLFPSYVMGRCKEEVVQDKKLSPESKVSKVFLTKSGSFSSEIVQQSQTWNQ